MKKAYFTGVFLIIFVIPLVIMVTLYTHILVQLRNKARDNKRASMLEMGEQQQVSKRIFDKFNKHKTSQFSKGD